MRKLGIVFVIFLTVIASFWFLFKSDLVANNSTIIDLRISYENWLSGLRQRQGVFTMIVDYLSPSEVMVKIDKDSEGYFTYRLNDLKLINLAVESDVLMGTFQDGLGRIYKSVIYPTSNQSAAKLKPPFIVVVDANTGVSIRNVQSDEGISKYEVYYNEIKKGKYFNIYWKDKRYLSEINRYYNSSEYNWESSEPIYPMRLIIFD